ncbi:MAG TPA: DUF302 domain-containing protein [Terriglobales bacterium]|nr:DUF302 domain-containing protein [Terriglobales bacterium]
MPDAKDGLIHTASAHSFQDTLQKLEAILRDKAMTIFARIDHSDEAAKVGMEMHPTQLLIFGNPRGGTPPMLAAPTLAIDLPLKALVWEDDQGKVWITHNTAEYLQRRHGFPREFLPNLAGAATLIQKAVE